MTVLTSFHLIMAIFVYVVQRKHSRSTHLKTNVFKSDSVREVLKSFVSKPPHVLWVTLATLVPLYVMATSSQITNVHWEKIGLMGLMLAIVRSVQIIINKEHRSRMEYTTPLVTITLLMAVYHNVIPGTQRNLIYPFIMAHALLVLSTFPTRTTTSTIVDDVVLSHLMFYLFK